MIKNQQISVWSFYNDYAAAIPVAFDEENSKKIKSQLLPKKRLSPMFKDSQQQKINQPKTHHKMNLSKVTTKNPALCEKQSLNLDSTNQSLAKKQQQNGIDFEQIKTTLKTQIQDSLVVHLILSELKQQKNNQSFLKLQQHRQRKICQQTIKRAEALKFPKIDKSRKCSEIVLYKFGEQMQRKPVEFTNQQLQEVLRRKIQSIRNHKIKALGTNKQIVIRSSRHESLFIQI